MQSSETIGKIGDALAKAQSVIAPAPKDKANPFFKSHYADLASITDACRKALTDNGIAVVQGFTAVSDGFIQLDTRLIHISGEWIEGNLVMPAGGTAQSYGSAITYGRRYALAAMVGVVADEDDDGNAASQKPTNTQQPKPATKPAPKPPALDINATRSRLFAVLGEVAPNWGKATKDLDPIDAGNRNAWASSVLERDISSLAGLSAEDYAKLAHDADTRLREPFND